MRKRNEGFDFAFDILGKKIRVCISIYIYIDIYFSFIDFLSGQNRSGAFL